jgi:hypothetical protein
MKRDLSLLITNLDGTPINMQPQNVPLTVAFSLNEALLNTTPQTPAEEKAKRWGLVKKIRAGGIISLTDNEEALIRQACGDTMPTLIFGQIVDWLETDTDKSAA